MTAAAIETWRERAKAKFPAEDIDQIARLLSEASARAELLADNSRDVFEPEHRLTPDSLNEIRVMLDGALSQHATR